MACRRHGHRRYKRRVHELQSQLFRVIMPACFSDTTRARSKGVCRHLSGGSQALRHSGARCSKCSENLLLKSVPECTGTATPPWFQPHYCFKLSLQQCWTHVILTDSTAVGHLHLTFWGVSSHALSRPTKLSSSQSFLVRKVRTNTQLQLSKALVRRPFAQQLRVKLHVHPTWVYLTHRFHITPFVCTPKSCKSLFQSSARRGLKSLEVSGVPTALQDLPPSLQCLHCESDT